MITSPQQNPPANTLRSRLLSLARRLRAHLREPRNLIVAAAGAAAFILFLILAISILSPTRAPSQDALENAAAAALHARHGKLYTLSQLTPGPALKHPPAPPADIANPDSRFANEDAAPADRAPPPHSTSNRQSQTANPPATAADASPVSPIIPITLVTPASPVTPTPVPDGHIHYDATLTARLSEALYQPVDTPGFITNELKLDASAGRKIDEILNAPGGARIRELAGIAPGSDSLAGVRLIRETARAGARIEFSAHIDASRALRSPGGWHISITSLSPKNPLPQGDTLDTFTGRLLDITRESDLATLRRLVTQAGETLRRVETARDRHRAELAANSARTIAAHLAHLAPGTLHTGRATIPGQRATPALCLEIITLDRDNSAIRASLRADSSWIDARPLEGRYAYNADTGLLTLTLAAPAGLPLTSADGITIAAPAPFRLTLQLAPPNLSGDTGSWSCKLTRVPDDARAAAITSFSAAEQQLLDATRPGLTYRLDTPGHPGPLLIRFQTQNPATGALTATIEDARAGWTRDVRGTLAARDARDGARHVRLDGAPDPAQPAAAAIELTLSLGDKNVFKGLIRLPGQPDPRPVTAGPATPDFLASLDSPAKTRAAQDAPAAPAPPPERLRSPTRPSTPPTPSAPPAPPAPPVSPAAPAIPRVSSPAAPAIAATPAPNPLDHLDKLPATETAGAWIWDETETAWKPLPVNNARVVRSTLQKAGGVWSGAVSLVKKRPDKQETGTLTFDGTDTPPAVAAGGALIVFRGSFTTYPGTPPGTFPIEIAPLETKGKTRRRTAELDRLGAAAATFGKKSEPLLVELSTTAPNLHIIRPLRQLPPARYALNAPGHAFEFEIKK